MPLTAPPPPKKYTPCSQIHAIMATPQRPRHVRRTQLPADVSALGNPHAVALLHSHKTRLVHQNPSRSPLPQTDVAVRHHQIGDVERKVPVRGFAGPDRSGRRRRGRMIRVGRRRQVVGGRCCWSPTVARFAPAPRQRRAPYMCRHRLPHKSSPTCKTTKKRSATEKQKNRPVAQQGPAERAPGRGRQVF